MKLDTKLLREPRRFFNHGPSSHFLRSLFKLPHHLYGRVSITIESNRTVNLRGFMFISTERKPLPPFSRGR